MKLSNILKKHQISTRALAELLDISPATITYWKSNNDEVPTKYIRQVERVLSTLERIAINADSSIKDVVKPIIEIKKSPLWEGYELLEKRLAQDITQVNSDILYLRENIKHIAPGFKKDRTKEARKKNFREPLVAFGENHKKKVFALFYEEEIFDLNHIKELEDIFKSMNEAFGEIEFILVFQICEKESLLSYLKESFNFSAFRLEQEAQYELVKT